MTTSSAGLRGLPATPRIRGLRDRHLAFYRSLADQARQAGLDGSEEAWEEILESDLDNLRAAIAWALESQDAAAALDLASGCRGIWTKGRYAEGLQWLARSLALEGGPPAARLWALVATADIELNRGERKIAATRAQEAVELARSAGDTTSTVAALQVLAQAEVGEAATAAIDEAVELSRGAGIDPLLATSLRIASRAALVDFPKSRRLAEEAGVAARHCSAEVRVAALGRLADQLNTMGEIDAALTAYENALDLRRQMRGSAAVADFELSSLGWIALQREDFDRAEALYAEVRELVADRADQGAYAGACFGLAEVARHRGDAEAKVTELLLSAVDAVETQSLEPGPGAHWNQAAALDRLAELSELRADHNSARAYLEKRSQIPRRNTFYRPYSLERLAGLAYRLGDVGTALRLGAEYIEELEGFRSPPSFVRRARAELARMEGNDELAYEIFTSHLSDTPRGEWEGGRNLAKYALRVGDVEMARQAARKEIEFVESTVNGSAIPWLAAAQADLAAGDYPAATSSTLKAMTEGLTIWTAPLRLSLVETIARVRLAGGDAQGGAELLGVAKGERDRLQYATDAYDAGLLEGAANQARAALVNEAFEAAFDRGRLTPIERAIAEAKSKAGA